VAADTRTRPLPVICLVGVAAGVVLVAVGLAWPLLNPGRKLYTPAQAAEWEQAGAALHAATSGHAADGSRLPADPAEREKIIAAARQRYEKAQGELESARFAQNELGTWLIGIGLAAVIAFGIGYAVSRRDAEA
jgi:hypothetical protein